ncbi:MAG: serine/threonine protein kinase [Planctomycetes bacterium]|nr:serine/threonine protein kinase [Planctomycetota bacterium]
MASTSETIEGYRLRTLLQNGADSQVFEVVEVRSNRHFAMKLLHPEAAAKSEKRELLFNEAEIGNKLRHENVIHIVKICRDLAHPHFIMEYFPSGSLRDKVRKKDTEFIKEHARKIFKQMATGLAYMHGNKFVHRDVKPDNILVNASGQLRLIDFAISKKIPTGFAKWFYRRKKAQGTPSFMSPEQARDEMPDPRMDIYSLAATFYELLTYRPPFRGTSMQDLLNKQVSQKPDSPQSYNPDISDEMSALILKMLAKKKEDRPQTCHDVMMTIRKIKIFKSQPIPIEDEQR